jgi:hypothetical protein
MSDPLVESYVEAVVRAELDAITGAAGAEILRHSVALYSDNGTTWEPAGTAVLVRVNGRELLLTAKHAVDCFADGEFELVIAVDRAEIRVPTIHFAWPADEAGVLDACAFSAPAESLELLRSRRAFVDLDQPVILAREPAARRQFKSRCYSDFPAR